MTLLYYQDKKENNFSQRTLERNKLIDIKIMSFCININKLTDIIKYILSDFCDASVIGYEKNKNTYWCKIYDRTRCSLHVEMEIFKHTDDISFVKFKPLICSDDLLENFISNFSESIQLYATSPFIRSCLEGKSGF